MLNRVDEGRSLLRELQTLLFEDELDKLLLFDKTLQIDDLLNKASVDYNKYLNDVENFYDK